MKSIFISYSYKDKEFVRRLASDLRARGIQVWVDSQEIRVGDSIIQKISEGIERADYVLVVLSQSSIQSVWVQKEVRTAFVKDPAGAKGVLIPVVLEKTQIPSFLQGIKYADFTTSYEEGLDEILDAIVKTPPKETPSPTQLFDVGDFAKEVAKEVIHILQANPQGMSR